MRTLEFSVSSVSAVKYFKVDNGVKDILQVESVAKYNPRV